MSKAANKIQDWFDNNTSVGTTSGIDNSTDQGGMLGGSPLIPNAASANTGMLNDGAGGGSGAGSPPPQKLAPVPASTTMKLNDGTGDGGGGGGGGGDTFAPIGNGMAWNPWAGYTPPGSATGGSPPPTATPPTPPQPAQYTPATYAAPVSTIAPAGSQTPATINKNDLTMRTIDPATETAEGRQIGMLSGNNPYIQGFRDRVARAANERGLSNSSIAVSGGEEAAANASEPIALADAAAYQSAGHYDTALKNQALMYNVDEQNQYKLQANTIAGQQAIAQISAATSIGVAGINATAQLSAASLQAENQRFIAQMNNAQSKYNTDQNYRTQQDNNHNTLVNNIMNNMELSPDRKAAMLTQLGEGGLASAIYVHDPDLNFGGTTQDGATRVNASGIHQIFRNGFWQNSNYGGG